MYNTYNGDKRCSSTPFSPPPSPPKSTFSREYYNDVYRYNNFNCSNNYQHHPSTTIIQKNELKQRINEDHSEKAQIVTKTLSRMSIDFMLDNHRDKEYANTPSPPTSIESEFSKEIGDIPLKIVEDSLHKNSTKRNVKIKNNNKKSIKKQRNKEMRISHVMKPERKRKGNSLARVMADRGLLESIFSSDISSTDIKSVRIPPPPSMQYDELISEINKLNIDHGILDDHSIDITWKGQPLNITHLPHYKELHETEAKVVSILRLTPIQYLTGKHTLISAARRYAQRTLPFKKSDAQKLLRIDVNKASKLWEFFRSVKWI